MNCIAYLDMLGTKGFSDDANVYYENIRKFSESVSLTATMLGPGGSVGFFSDCAYAESDDLQKMLDFLVLLRDHLMSEGLFFNAVVQKGELGFVATKDEKQNIYGVTFENSQIAELFIKQTNFKGVGIYIDKSITDEEIRDTKFQFVNCIYVGRSDENGVKRFFPCAYRDISMIHSDVTTRQMEDTLRQFLRTFYSSFMKSPRYGAYYVSLFSNFIRSFGKGLKWDMSKKEFKNPPLIFNVLRTMLMEEAGTLGKLGKLRELPGLDYLVFVMLDEIYLSKSLSDTDKECIAKEFFEIGCIGEKYFHDLNSVPENIFSKITLSSGVERDNRDRFIGYCQNDLAKDFANTILNEHRQKRAVNG